MPVVAPLRITEKITLEFASKFTGRLLMRLHRGRRILQRRVARNQVRPFAGQLRHDVLVQQRVADLDDAEHDDEQQRQDERELDDALAALVAPSAGWCS